MKYLIQIEYDGSAFHGWQSQPDGLTVQDNLERAIGTIAGKRTQVHAAGRTDTGVHALAQMAHFDTDAERPLQAWVRGVNAHLPQQISVRTVQTVSDEFHARFSARSRSYRYVLFNHPVRPTLQAGRVGWYHRPLNAELMHAAALLLIGEHDFSSFRSSQCQANSPVKHLIEASVFRQSDYVIFEFRAGGFLHHMVRNLVGALIRVGQGLEPVEWMGTLLRQCDRTLAPPTFMPDGLYFTGVDYGDGWNLPNQGRIIAPPLFMHP